MRCAEKDSKLKTSHLNPSYQNKPPLSALMEQCTVKSVSAIELVTEGSN